MIKAIEHGKHGGSGARNRCEESRDDIKDRLVYVQPLARHIELRGFPALFDPAKARHQLEVGGEEIHRIRTACNPMLRGQLRKERAVRNGLTEIGLHPGAEGDDIRPYDQRFILGRVEGGHAAGCRRIRCEMLHGGQRGHGDEFAGLGNGSHRFVSLSGGLI